MFSLIRLIIFAALAFVAGTFFERNNAREACELRGGDWVDALCIGTQP